MELRYAGDDKLFVPVERLDLVQKYTGGARARRSTGSAGTTWEKRQDARHEGHARHGRGAAEALRRAQGALGGHSFSADTHWQQEFEDAFEYEVTPDQQTAIADIKRDMEAPDADGPAALRRRRLRQDRGRDARRVQGGHGRQAGRGPRADDRPGLAALQDVPRALRRRSRCGSTWSAGSASKAEQKAILADLAAGKVDIIVGTHRLLSKDVAVPRPRPAGRGRGAALRRRAQGAHQADAPKRWTC